MALANIIGAGSSGVAGLHGAQQQQFYNSAYCQINATSQAAGSINIYYDYACDRPLTHLEWLDRRINEMRVRL